MSSIHSLGKSALHYFMGAYTFSSTPPFEITAISQEPIVGPGFYLGKYYIGYWKSVVPVFPAGFIFDKEYIWVSYGRGDREVWIVKLDKQGLLDSLAPVTPDLTKKEETNNSIF